MNESIQKVTAFITQKRNGLNTLLVFKHPTASIQIPAGTVEVGEDIETAVQREVHEETGLQHVKIENELDEPIPSPIIQGLVQVAFDE